jgi:topoisomerase IA-like protein
VIARAQKALDDAVRRAEKATKPAAKKTPAKKATAAKKTRAAKRSR